MGGDVFLAELVPVVYKRFSLSSIRKGEFGP